MGDRFPGPICSSRVGDEWIDDGTLCRAKASAPRPSGASPADPAKAGYDAAHGYSLAPEARRKRAIDLQFIGGDYRKSADVRIDSEDYLKKLIDIASDGKQIVNSKAGEMQFFIVRGGAEGFLPDDLRNVDARNNVTRWESTGGSTGRTDFDENDVLAVFDAKGSLVASARLRRPTYVQGHLRRETATKVYDAWPGKKVFIYQNKTPGWIPYLGLALDDGFRDGTANKGKKVSIDLHKEEQTNGCIFIVDEASATTSDLNTFEPELIRKILAAKGLTEAKLAKGREKLGTMRVVTIKL